MTQPPPINSFPGPREVIGSRSATRSPPPKKNHFVLTQGKVGIHEIRIITLRKPWNDMTGAMSAGWSLWSNGLLHCSIHCQPGAQQTPRANRPKLRPPPPFFLLPDPCENMTCPCNFKYFSPGNRRPKAKATDVSPHLPVFTWVPRTYQRHSGPDWGLRCSGYSTYPL